MPNKVMSCHRPLTLSVIYHIIKQNENHNRETDKRSEESKATKQMEGEITFISIFFVNEKKRKKKEGWIIVHFKYYQSTRLECGVSFELYNTAKEHKTREKTRQ